MMKYLSINGQKDTSLSALDRACNYGDGLFTTAKIFEGKVELLPAHLQRLKQGCERLFIADINFNTLEAQLIDIASSHALAVIKVLISAGSGGRGYSREGVSEPSIVISVHEFPTNYLSIQQQGLTMGVANTMLGINPQLAGIKHLNRLEQVLVRRELDSRSEQDLLVLNIQQQVIEASSANVFYQINNQWYTPDIKLSGVDGIMRQHLLSLLPNVTISQHSLQALDSITAMFICNCVFGVVPVTCFNETTLDIAPVLKVKELLL